MKPDRTVYHYSCTARLPRILAAGELRPSEYTGFLWATTCATPEPTSRPILNLNPRVPLVRFTLRARDFVPYDERIIARHWGPEHVSVRKCDIRKWGRSVVESWHVRPGALPLERVTGIEILARCGRWEPLTAGEKARMLEEGICEMLADAHYAKKDEDDDYEGYED